MKPHCMFFDEAYSEGWYRSETVKSFVNDKMDALIVVGTALQTSLARLIVSSAINKDTIPVIEINLEPCIEDGFVIQVCEGSETALPDLVREYIKLKDS